MRLAKQHQTEAKLINGDEIEKSWKLLADERVTKWSLKYCHDD